MILLNSELLSEILSYSQSKLSFGTKTGHKVLFHLTMVCQRPGIASHVTFGCRLNQNFRFGNFIKAVHQPPNCKFGTPQEELNAFFQHRRPYQKPLTLLH